MGDETEQRGYDVNVTEDSPGWIWAPRVDPECGEYGVFVNQGNRLVIGHDGNLVVTGARIILNNHFAPMPICGYSYASAQFIGRGSTEVSFQMAAIGDYKLSWLQSMVEELEKNARGFRRVAGAGRVTFSNNEFLQLAGIEDGIVTSIDTETDPQGTNLYRCQISFTSDGHHTERFTQELYTDYDTKALVLEALLRRVRMTIFSPEMTRRIENTREGALPADIRVTVGEMGAEGGRRLGRRVGQVVGGGLPGTTPTVAGSLAERAFGEVGRTVGEFHGWVFDSIVSSVRESAARRGYGRGSVDILSADGALEIARNEGDRALRITEGIVQAYDHTGNVSDAVQRVQRQERRGAYLRQPVRTPVSSEQDRSAAYLPITEPRYDWVNTYTQRICEVFRQWSDRLPGQPFFRGPNRGRYEDYRNAGPTTSQTPGGRPAHTVEAVEGRLQNWPPVLGNENSLLCSMIHGRRRRWGSLRSSSQTGRNVIETALFQFEDQLMQIASDALNASRGQEGFDEVFPGAAALYDSAPARTAHPCYPDLELPPHPVSTLAIDTEPDFYFFNDSEEGLMNEIGPDIIQDIDDRIQNMGTTYNRLMGGEEWRRTYLGRSRTGIMGLPFDETEEASLCTVDRTAPPEGSMGRTLDNATVGRDINPGNTTPNQQRRIGGRVSLPGNGADIKPSVVDQVLTMSPTTISSAHSSRETLRARRMAMLRSTSMRIPEGTATDGIGIGPIDTTLGLEDRSHSFSRNALRSIVMQSLVQSPEETLTMRRAFPTFKIYFIEDDTGVMRDEFNLPAGGVRPVLYFDDLYSYNSVRSIRLIRSRKTPSDLLVLELTNVTGLLERRRWIAPGERPREIYAPGFEETEMENPLKKIIMKEGLKVQARLGHTNSPLKMGKKFVGEVVELSYNADVSDVVTIVCQGYGSELVLEGKGLDPNQRAAFVDTPDLVHTIMCSPELVHFGRYDLNPQFNPGEARAAATSRRDPSTGGTGTAATGIVQDPRALIQNYQEMLCLNRSKWILANEPADDNIFAPSKRDWLTQRQQITADIGSQMMWGSDWIRRYADMYSDIPWYAGGFGPQAAGWLFRHVSGAVRSVGDRLNDASFVLAGQNIWQILKECELRHPGWIAHPRPYGTRMTLFFGVPSHKYWCDEITREEMTVLQRLRQASEDAWRRNPVGHYASARAIMRRDAGRTVEALEGLTSLSDNAQQWYMEVCRWAAQNRWMQDVGTVLGQTLGRFKPFRRHHLITSKHHLIANNIRASAKGTFNAVSLQYAGGVYNLKADDSIPDELTRVEMFNYPSCDNETLARRYCIGLLNRHLKDVYKGEILVTGMDIDPYDSVYLHDDRTGMYGAFEVEQVVDTFTPQTGWVTEITPDLITGTNEFSTRITGEARTAVFGSLIQRYLGIDMDSENISTEGLMASVWGHALFGTGISEPITAIGVAAPLAIGAGLAWWGGYYVVRWTQDRQPIWVCPLILGDRPYFSGLDGFKQEGIFASLRGKLHAEIDAISEGWRTLHLNGVVGAIGSSIARQAAGQAGP